MVEDVVAASVYVANQLARGSPLGRQVLYYTALQSYILGLKSEDPLSPAYIPSLFSFTPSPKKRRTEQGLERYEAAKRRGEEKDRTEAADGLVALADDVVHPLDTVSVATQTDLTSMVLSALEEDNQRMTTELAEVRVAKGYPNQEDLKGNDKILRFYTGLSSFTVLMALFKLVSVAIPEGGAAKLSQFEYFILTLMKLRLNASNYDLGFRFGVSESTVSRVFAKWIEAMDIRLSFLITWPDRESIRKTMPFCFRPHYGLRVTSIIDCFELFIEKPSDLLAKSCTWSQYKHYNTAKYLISITPQGIISFISNGWGGRVSDKHIVEHSGYLSNLLPGDVLADRGFDVADSVAMLGATLDIPAFTRGCEQLPPSDVEATRKLANVRIHVERIIGAVRQRFQVLSATGALQKELISQKNSRGVVLDSVVRVCCALNNVLEGIVPFD